MNLGGDGLGVRTSADDNATDGACAFAHDLDACAVEDEAIPEALLRHVALEDARELVAPREVEHSPRRCARPFENGVAQARQVVRADEEQRR